MREEINCFFNTRGPDKNVVIYEVYDQLVIRSYTPPKNPRTELQQANRNLHRLISQVSGRTKPLREFCFKQYPSFVNAHIAFISLQKMWLADLVRRSEKEIVKELLWSSGDLEFPGWISFDREHQPVLQWQVKNPEEMSRKEFRTQVVWIAYHCNSSSWKWHMKAGLKRTGYCEMKLPDEWQDDEIYVWLLYIDPQKNDFSRSRLLIVPEGEKSVKKEFSRRQLTNQSILENQVLHHWLESRNYRGREKRWYVKKHEQEMGWRPWSAERSNW